MTTLLKANQIRVEFGDLVAVRDVSFEMAGGDLLGLIGPNGAGKTTLLRVLAGLRAPTAGSAEILGHDVFSNGDPIRGRIGFAPDSPPAYEELTVEQFLQFIAEAHGLPRKEGDERIDFWLEQVWLEKKRNVRIKNLSRGMRQRVTIAQTLLPNPMVVLLDEPSSGLDPAGRIQLREIIASLGAQGKATIVSSHILADLEEYCTHVAIIEHGRILRYSAVADLHKAENNRCGYRLTVLGDDDVSEAIMALEGVSHLVRDDHTYTFEFCQDEQEAGALLRQLIERGLCVTSFGAVRKSLEDVYIKTGVKQVD